MLYAYLLCCANKSLKYITPVVQNDRLIHKSLVPPIFMHQISYHIWNILIYISIYITIPLYYMTMDWITPNHIIILYNHIVISTASHTSLNDWLWIATQLIDIALWYVSKHWTDAFSFSFFSNWLIWTKTSTSFEQSDREWGHNETPRRAWLTFVGAWLTFLGDDMIIT